MRFVAPRSALLGAFGCLALALAACGSSGDDSQEFPEFGTPQPEGADCRPSAGHVAFAVSLPRVFPDGVQLVEACTHEEPNVPLPQSLEQAEFMYETLDGSATLAVVTARLDVAPLDREVVDLAGTPGYVRTRPHDDGTRTHSIEFSKDGRAYTVIAVLGPDNLIDEADLTEVALSVATSPAVGP